jgi:hypothetical protein
MGVWSLTSTPSPANVHADQEIEIGRMRTLLAKLS